ncbi:MAG: CBS domain-containing protein [Syntrophorhabdaceae bacterium]|nr:CBS domain-containing protein [Syntrophorhabdaceae bacterium]
MKTVRDILKNKKSEVWSISPKAMVFDALALMGEKEIGALMVIDEKGKVAGIISERDYARKIILVGKTSKETPVEQIMTPASQMYTVKPETTVDDCMVLITGKKIRHIPVFEGEKFLGVISIGDVVKSIISEQETLIEHLSNYIAGKYV